MYLSILYWKLLENNMKCTIVLKLGMRNIWNNYSMNVWYLHEGFFFKLQFRLTFVSEYSHCYGEQRTQHVEEGDGSPQSPVIFTLGALCTLLDSYDIEQNVSHIVVLHAVSLLHSNFAMLRSESNSNIVQQQQWGAKGFSFKNEITWDIFFSPFHN